MAEVACLVLPFGPSVEANEFKFLQRTRNRSSSSEPKVYPFLCDHRPRPAHLAELRPSKNIVAIFYCY